MEVEFLIDNNPERITYLNRTVHQKHFKAHPDVFNILLQIMDYATLTDNNGRKTDFRQVILIMTTTK